MNTVPDVRYFSVEGCAKKFFRCAALRSSLSTDACAANWHRAQRLGPDELGWMATCGGCAIGSEHAGERPVHRSRLFGLTVCPRCGKYSGRIINETRCVSCYNREREFLLGANAKGTLPQKCRLAARRIGAVIDGKRIDVFAERTASTIELALALLRVVSGRVMFCKPGTGAAISLTDLVAKHRVSPTDPLRRPLGRKGRRRGA